MVKNKVEKTKYLKIANFLSVAMVLFLSASFILEVSLTKGATENSVTSLVMIVTLIIVVTILRIARNYYKLAFNVPIVLFLFYTVLMALSKWEYSSHYFLVCLAFCGISCVYSSFNRSVSYIVVQNVIIGYFFMNGYTVAGPHATFVYIMVNWIICILGSIILLLLTRSATVALSKALEHKQSFTDLLATTENYVAIVDDSNKVVYASKTLANLGSVEDSSLVQGRPLLDFFPGRSLKIYAGKMIKEKENYIEDWEFSLNGQKRYFKAISHGLPGNNGALISLYDMTHLAERDEIAVMKDSMKIGLFFMDKDYVIQDHYSRYLEEMLVETGLFGKLFIDVIADSVTPNELESIKDYLGMVMERSYDQEMLDDINPLNELHYVNSRTGDRKVFQCAFATVERAHGEVFLLVTIYDITAKAELQQRLAEEEGKRQEEMQAFFELIQVEPDVFSDFMEDMEHEFGSIDRILKDSELSSHEALVKIYQSIHAIKSNAVILGLSIFGNKVHNLESKIKKMREQTGEVPFVEMLNLTMDIEKISQEREGFKQIIGKLQTYSAAGAGGKRQNIKVLVDSLDKTASKAAEDMEKYVKFAADDIDAEAIEKGPRRVIKEILMQLIRNSVVHGIELPEVRKASGKDEVGIITLSIKMAEDHENINVKLSDDGKGLDYKKIAERALENKLIKKQDAENKDVLLKIIFAPGFSTAETEGVHAGRGIGLNLVRDRVKEVNGNIKLRSETGKGTTFSIAIPIEKKQEPKKK